VLEIQQKRIEDEMNAYRAQDPAERKKSWRLVPRVGRGSQPKIKKKIA